MKMGNDESNNSQTHVRHPNFVKTVKIFNSTEVNPLSEPSVQNILYWNLKIWLTPSRDTGLYFCCSHFCSFSTLVLVLSFWSSDPARLNWINLATPILLLNLDPRKPCNVNPIDLSDFLQETFKTLGVPFYFVNIEF